MNAATQPPIPKGTPVMTSFPLVDGILLPFAAVLGGDRAAYHHHVYRVLNFYAALAGDAQDIPDAVLIAAAFHDLGIWTDDTFDYLEPSVRLAGAYLASAGLTPMEAQVRAIILEHHKLRVYAGPFGRTVELYRKADLVDVSLGIIGHGLPRARIRAVRAAFPNAGFHRRLVALTARQFARSPLRPLPMIHW